MNELYRGRWNQSFHRGFSAKQTEGGGCVSDGTARGARRCTSATSGRRRRTTRSAQGSVVLPLQA
jgi:hypothetical protein